MESLVQATFAAVLALLIAVMFVIYVLLDIVQKMNKDFNDFF